MHRKIQFVNACDISEEEYLELCKQPAARMVVEAVRQYNEGISQSREGEVMGDNPLLVKETEEEETKVFLDAIFDITEEKNSLDNKLDSVD